MKIQNYTSGVPAAKSVSEIEAFLVAVGAENISKGYVSGLLRSLTFSVDIPSIGQHVFRIPVKVKSVQAIFSKGRRRTQQRSEKTRKEQAERTAWRIVRDWVEVQCTMIRLEQADAMEVFLPYMLVRGQTLYHKLSESKFKLLGDGK